MTIVCVMNATTTIFNDKPILHIRSKIHSNLNTRTLSFVPKQSTVCMHLYSYCTLSTIVLHFFVNSHARAKLHNNFFNVAYNLRYLFIVTINSEEISYLIMYCCTVE